MFLNALSLISSLRRSKGEWSWAGNGNSTQGIWCSTENLKGTDCSRVPLLHRMMKHVHTTRNPCSHGKKKSFSMLFFVFFIKHLCFFFNSSLGTAFWWSFWLFLLNHDSSNSSFPLIAMPSTIHIIPRLMHFLPHLGNPLAAYFQK